MSDSLDGLVEFYKKRQEQGIIKYRKDLHPFNGRSMIKDALEEVMDATRYLYSALEEEKVLKPLARRAADILRRHGDAELKPVWTFLESLADNTAGDDVVKDIPLDYPGYHHQVVRTSGDKE